MGFVEKDINHQRNSSVEFLAYVDFLAWAMDSFW
jgi:hypothetical protein